ncbi:autotransporter domain-containing protein [Xenorhabdus sp. 12]|uniref:Autotransporter domain-containing protein n=1 Tax=Xenorhabdus santafensis TaxID=2582833 RepID=A0ABU4S834_9GAMM|nr:autotransporter domain-containing protein [Xenorhabdus sp. 12]MDX7986934.1 autotransporter domain-containing protein [Xenorhabdus sp. 12]
MKKAFLFTPALLAILISPLSQAFIDEDLCIIGDSLSDTGNVKAIVIAKAKAEAKAKAKAEGKTEAEAEAEAEAAAEAAAKELQASYTTDGNTSMLWHEEFAGRKSTPSLLGGTNYAVGGATAIEKFNLSNPNNTTANQLINCQRNRTTPNRIYVHYIGGNDIKAALVMNQEMLFNLKDFSAFNPDSLIKESADAAVTQINALTSNSKNLVIAPTIPDVGATPILLEMVLKAGIEMKVNTIMNTEMEKIPPFFRPLAEAIIQAKTKEQIENILGLVHLKINKATIPNEEARQLALQKVFEELGQQAGKKVQDMTGKSLKDINLDPKTIEKELAEGYAKASAVATALTEAYNKRVDDNINGNILRVDFDGLLREAIANPLIYGFGNNLGYACGLGVAANQCSSEPKGSGKLGPKDFDGSKQFIFSDGFHPSPLAHKIMGQSLKSSYIAPIQVMTLNQVNRLAVNNTRHSLDAHLQQLRKGGNEQGKIGVFGAYTGNRHNSFTLGGDYQLAENFLLGALYSNDKFDRSSTSDFNYNGTAHVVTGYALWNAFDNAWLNADFHYARTKYDDLTRSIQLGMATRRETGATKGNQWGGRLSAGWDIPVTNAISTSPIFQFAWDKGDIDGYRESTQNSTSMRFGDQKYTSKVATLGLRVDTQLGRFNPYASIKFNHQFGDNRYTLRSAIKSTRTSFVMESDQQKRNWREYTIGANANLVGNVRGFASATRNEGRSQDPKYYFTLGINASF